MAHYKCESTPSCSNFQSAICLHCNRRLCLAHITEHNQVVPSSIQNLLKEVERTFEQINNEYERSRETYNFLLTSLNQWRTRQTEKLQELYNYHLQSIESQQEALNIIQQDLTEALDRDARQPLKDIQNQQSANMEIVDHIRETIDKAQKHCGQLKWNPATIIPEDIKYDSKDHSSMQISKSSHHQPIRKTNFSSRMAINLRKYRAFRRLVDMFSSISSIEQNKEEIAVYLKMQGPNFKLPILICSYLTAWHRILKEDEKTLMLNEHLSTIIKYTSHLRRSSVTLFGIHAFFYNEHISGNKREMMAFLLQYFIDHQCLTRNDIVNWYNHKDLHDYEGFDGIKQLTTPFIKSLCMGNKVPDGQASTSNPTAAAAMQWDNQQIKEEAEEFFEEN